jgi:putative FmdB family regulatory protein
MPIYVYRCTQCGLEKEVLQKVSELSLTECPSCHQLTFNKQLTAAGFQLKGSGWYETDFKNKPKPTAEKVASEPVTSGTGDCPAVN